MSTYSTSCDWGTPWLHSIESNCLHPDAIKHNNISGKIATFEDVCGHLRPSWINNYVQWPTLVLLRCAVMSHNITQQCVLALFSFMLPRSAFYRTCIGEFLTTTYHIFLWSFTAGFYFQSNQLQF